MICRQVTDPEWCPTHIFSCKVSSEEQQARALALTQLKANHESSNLSQDSTRLIQPMKCRQVTDPEWCPTHIFSCKVSSEEQQARALALTQLEAAATFKAKEKEAEAAIALWRQSECHLDLYVHSYISWR
jgi:hypothetical protein